MKVLLIISVFCLAVIFNVSGQATPQEMLNKAIYQEEVNGNLDEAIKLFLEIVDKNSTNRAVTVEAFYHLGLTNEKLGNKKAKEYYEKIVNSFGDQPEFVRIARERLARLTTIESPKGIAIRQVWTGLDVDDFGRVSADGEYLTFMDQETGDLAIRNLRTNENTRLTHEGTWDDPIHFALYNAISPDGKQIVYCWYNDKQTYDLKLIDLGNKTPVTLYSADADIEIYPVSWFSDGKRIIVQKFKKLNDKYTWQLSSVNINTREFKILKEFNTAFMTRLVLSQNDKYIAYDFPNLNDNRKFDINLMSIDGSEEINLVKHPANDRLLGWIPGRNELLFTSDRSGTTDVWALNTLTDRLSEQPKRILVNVGEIDPRGFTQNGSLYYSITYRRFESFIVPYDPNTGKLSLNSRTPLLDSFGDMCWLPDGETIIGVQQLIQSDGSGIDYKLWVLNTKTGVKRDLDSNNTLQGPPQLSPDYKSVLFFGMDDKRSEDTNYKGGIYTIDINTGNVSEIKVNQNVSQSYSVEWDKDGKCIFYTSNNQIIRHNIKTGEENILYTDNYLGSTTSLKRSHDGDNLLFDVQVNNNETHLKSIPVTGGEVRIISKFNKGYTPLLHKKLALSPDGKYIYFSITGTENGSALWRISAETGSTEKIWESKNRITGINIHPDGNQMAISVLDYGLEIRVMENLVQELEKLDKMPK
jgi:Tol biopolymer transport system component